MLIMLLAMKTRRCAELFGCPDEGRAGGIRSSVVVSRLISLGGLFLDEMQQRKRERERELSKKDWCFVNLCHCRRQTDDDSSLSFLVRCNRHSFFFCVFACVACLRRDITESTKGYPRTNGQNATTFGRTQDHLSINNTPTKRGTY